MKSQLMGPCLAWNPGPDSERLATESCALESYSGDERLERPCAAALRFLARQQQNHSRTASKGKRGQRNQTYCHEVVAHHSNLDNVSIHYQPRAQHMIKQLTLRGNLGVVVGSCLRRGQVCETDHTH